MQAKGNVMQGKGGCIMQPAWMVASYYFYGNRQSPKLSHTPAGPPRQCSKSEAQASTTAPRALLAVESAPYISRAASVPPA